MGVCNPWIGAHIDVNTLSIRVSRIIYGCRSGYGYGCGYKYGYLHGFWISIYGYGIGIKVLQKVW